MTPWAPTIYDVVYACRLLRTYFWPPRVRPGDKSARRAVELAYIIARGNPAVRPNLGARFALRVAGAPPKLARDLLRPTIERRRAQEKRRRRLARRRKRGY